MLQWVLVCSSAFIFTLLPYFLKILKLKLMLHGLSGSDVFMGRTWQEMGSNRNPWVPKKKKEAWTDPQHKNTEANKQKKGDNITRRQEKNTEVKNSQSYILLRTPKTSRRRPHASAECSRWTSCETSAAAYGCNINNGTQQRCCCWFVFTFNPGRKNERKKERNKKKKKRGAEDWRRRRRRKKKIMK